MTTPTAPATGSQPGAASLADPARLPLWQVPTFFAGLLLFLAVAGMIAVRPPRIVRELDRDFATLRKALAQTNEPAEISVDLAESIVARAAPVPQKAGEAHYLLACAYDRQIEQAPAERRGELRAKALDQLQQAENLGVAADDQPRLQYRIGKLLFQSDGNLPRAIDYLNRSVAQGAEDPATGFGMLTLAYLRLQPPDHDGALKANQKQLEVIASEEAAAPVRLLRGEILFNKGLRQEAIRVLERIGPTAPPTVRRTARFLQARCCQEEQLWNKAVPLWKEVLTNTDETPANRARILFVLGQCYRKLDPPDQAGAAAAWQEAILAGGDEGQAASLSLAELRLTSPNPAAALDDFIRALDKVTSAGNYHNSLIDIARVQELLEQGCRIYRDARDFERAQQLAAIYLKLAEPGRAQERYAEISEAWAADLHEQALKTGTAGAGALLDQSRARYRQAGAAYEQAGRGRKTAEQADLLWHSADCYAKGLEPSRALSVLESFVTLPVPPERQAEGWFAVGEARRALRQPEKAREAYYKSIEFPTSPVAARARYQLAVAEIDQKNFDQAEAILRQNLRAASAAPDRDAHEQSFYLLGNLLHQRGEFLQASVILKEACRQYPENQGALSARAHLGECYRKLALEANQKLKSPESYAGSQAHLARARQDWLEQALDVYQKLADHLDSTSLKSAGPVDARLLREASFAVAECRYDLGELPEALRLYKVIFQRYPRQVDSLQACVKIYQCYWAMSGPEKTRALEDLRVAVQLSLNNLPAMPPEAFDPQRSSTREGWLRWLNDVQAYLNQSRAPAVTPSPGGG
jgi:tetratricopeptide (TPR) repeat protein